MAERMPITAIVPWFGGKRTLAPTIVQELGPHSTYWEPFCGSMAVLLNKPEAGHESVNDLHGDLINLARVIQDRLLGPKLYRKLRRVLCSEHERERAIEDLDGEADAFERAYRYFIVNWLGRNGVSGTTSYKTTSYKTTSFAVRWTPFGGHAGSRWSNAVCSIPTWRRRLRRVTILCRDGFDVLGKIEDNKATAIYVDPPYVLKSERYQHDFADADHVRLAEILRRFTKARVVVSYYDHPAVRELYKGWTVREVYRNKNLHVQNRRGAERAVAPEILLINGPSYAAETKESLFAEVGS